jgi:hypothetical protein
MHREAALLYRKLPRARSLSGQTQTAAELPSPDSTGPHEVNRLFHSSLLGSPGPTKYHKPKQALAQALVQPLAKRLLTWYRPLMLRLQGCTTRPSVPSLVPADAWGGLTSVNGTRRPQSRRQEPSRTARLRWLDPLQALACLGPLTRNGTATIKFAAASHHVTRSFRRSLCGRKDVMTRQNTAVGHALVRGRSCARDRPYLSAQASMLVQGTIVGLSVGKPYARIGRGMRNEGRRLGTVT